MESDVSAGVGTKARLGWLAALALASVLATPGWARSADPTAGLVQVAIAETPTDVSLDDIVSGRARQGFSPLVERGLHVVGKPGRSVWLRLRLDLPDDGQARYVSLPRQAIDRLRLHQAGPPELVLEQTGIGMPVVGAHWPNLFVLPLPAGTPGPAILYLEVEGQGHLNLQPRLITEAQWQARAEANGRFYGFLYGLLFLVGVLAIARRWLTGERTLRVAAAAFGCLGASIVGNYHVQLTLGGASLASIPVVPVALWVMACGPLLWATQQYAGHDKNRPELAAWLDRTGFALVALAFVFLLLPSQWLAQLQVAALLVVATTGLVCGFSLLIDARQWRWGPVLVWSAFIPALLAIPLSMMQLLPATSLVTRGFQLLLALQMAIYLALPWLRRHFQERALKKRGGPAELSAEEKIAHAREWMISSLQAGIESAADDGDMEWIAYRRLMGGLKTVLPQTAAAVIAMNYHNEDLLLVEPKSAEPRFQMLLAQRGSLLKNLSRSMAPQQIGVDFTGPDGPLQQVLLAIIPLPIDRPGWGALVIERSAKVSYSDDELDICTEFAALATTAGDEAARAMQLRQANEIDAESGVYKREMIDQVLRRAQEVALKKRNPLAMLRVGLDGFDALSPEDATSVVHRVADVLREEIDYGEIIGRFAADQFLVLLAGRSIGEARTLGERICAAVRKQPGPGPESAPLTVSVGVAQMQLGERLPQMMLERAARALVKARQYGGNQVQAVAGPTG